LAEYSATRRCSLLHIGTNDITAGDQDANEVNGILDVIDDYEDANDKHVTVILALIINRMDHNEATTVFNSDVNNMALNRIANGDDIIIVDMEHALNYPDDMYDTRHPNDTGYAKMADVWYNALAARLRGDINGDGFVDWYDLKMMCEDWLSDGKGDINYNGNVDFFDFAVLGFAW
jgi:lysophospholipase L1-like esterase